MGAGTGGSRSPTSKDRPRERPAATATRNTAGGKAYTDKASGKTYDSPKYGGASIKGLTSKDPANVARNRAGAAKYSSVKDRIASAATRDGNADKAAARAVSVRPGISQSAAAAAAARKAAAAVPPAAPTTMATRPPAGYRPGIDPEFNYGAGAPAAATTPRPVMAARPAVAAMAAPRVRVQPTITLAKGGKAPRKKK